MLRVLFRKAISKTDFLLDNGLLQLNRKNLTDLFKTMIPSDAKIKTIAQLQIDKLTQRTDQEVKDLADTVHKDTADEIIQTLIDAGALRAHATTDADGNIVWGFNNNHPILAAVDSVAPVIQMTTNETTLNVGDVFVPLAYVGSITDNVDGTIQPLSGLVISPKSIDMSVVGDHTVTYTATDKAGNEAVAKLIVHVVGASTVVAEETSIEVNAIIDAETQLPIVANATTNGAMILEWSAEAYIMVREAAPAIELLHNGAVIDSVDMTGVGSGAAVPINFSPAITLDWSAGDTLAIRGTKFSAATALVWTIKRG